MQGMKLEGGAKTQQEWFGVYKNSYPLPTRDFLPELLLCSVENGLLVSGGKSLKKAKDLVCLEHRVHFGKYDKTWG